MSPSRHSHPVLVVHGHFYQPPRENPWTDEVPEEGSAFPFHDWNARISAECYRANAFARIYGAGRRIQDLANNYERISFNFGPTLARWVEKYDPRTEARIRAGDAAQVKRMGHGGAIAQVWGHPIAPLLSPHDRRTQIAWGLFDFKRRFGRDAEGIWLPETAADPTTLEALIEAGVKFTILAPEQVAAVRAPGDEWTPVDRDTVDTGRAYRYLHRDGSGRQLAIAIFDGPLSRSLAFGNAVSDAKHFLDAVIDAAQRSEVRGDRLVLAASDGELYGHHRKFADLTLAYATAVGAERRGVKVTNLAAFLAHHPPTWELQLAEGPGGEGTAWSCQHGLGRWIRDCSCAMDPGRGWSQAWRGPLRAALDDLRDRAAAFFEDAAGELLVDPWGARDAYGTVLDATVAQRRQFLDEFARPALGRDGGRERALLLLEMQRSALHMYASCGWFFDDIAGLEAAIVIRQAAHVVQLMQRLGAASPESSLLQHLAEGRSNMPELGTGADVYRRVLRDRWTPARAVARAAFGLLAAEPTPAGVPGHQVELAGPPRAASVKGTATVTQQRLEETTRVPFEARRESPTAFVCDTGGERVTLDDLGDEAARPLRLLGLRELAQNPATPALCTEVAMLASGLGSLPPSDRTDVQRLLARLLARYLGTLDRSTNEAAWGPALSLFVQAGLPADVYENETVLELIWEAVNVRGGHTAQLPPSLHQMADKLGLLPLPLEALEPEEVVAESTSARAH